MKLSLVLTLAFGHNLALAIPLGLPEHRNVESIRSESEILETRDPRGKGPWIDELIKGKCKKITAIYARGTLAPGNYGDVPGPIWFKEILKLQGGTANVARQGVEYDAAIAGYYDGGSTDGGKEVANLVRLAISKCPSTKIVLGGYSQGAQVIFKGLGRLSTSEAKKIKAITVFGDPYGRQAEPKVSSSIVKKWCHEDDPICHGTLDSDPFHLGAHQGYDHTVPAAAKFIDTKV